GAAAHEVALRLRRIGAREADALARDGVPGPAAGLAADGDEHLHEFVAPAAEEAVIDLGVGPEDLGEQVLVVPVQRPAIADLLYADGLQIGELGKAPRHRLDVVGGRAHASSPELEPTGMSKWQRRLPIRRSIVFPG